MQKVKQKIRPFILTMALIATLLASAWTYQKTAEIEGELIVSTQRRPQKKLNFEVTKRLPSTLAKADLSSSLLPRSFEKDLVSNPFAAGNWQSAPSPVNTPAVSVPPPVPSAPNFSYTYMGKLEQSTGKWLIYLSKGEQFFGIAKGDVFDNHYRFEGSQKGQFVFTYLPLKTRQFLPMPEAIEGMEISEKDGSP